MNDSFFVEPLKTCPKCGSENILIKVIPGANQARYWCQDCNSHDALRHCENRAKRTNSAMAEWSNAVRRKANYTCRICGSMKDTEAHHIIPIAHDLERQFVYAEGNGVCLCRNCHKRVHQYGGFK